MEKTKKMTCTANPVITATASPTQYSSGSTAVCAAAFIPVTVFVTNPHSTIVSLSSHISP